MTRFTSQRHSLFIKMCLCSLCYASAPRGRSFRAASRISDASDKKTGFYGRVYDKEQPHTLTKANYVSEDPKNDPYLIYINYIADNNIASENPFVPRVYEIKTIEDVRGRVKYKIEIERLKRLEELPEEVIIAMTNNLFLS